MKTSTKQLTFLVTIYFVFIIAVFLLVVFVLQNLTTQAIKGGAEVQKCQRETGKGFLECVNK